jgi:hypothetical protein
MSRIETLTHGAVYRFTRTDTLRYYRAAHLLDGTELLYPIQVSGTRIADESTSGRRFVLLYFMTKWGKLAAAGYWLDPRQAFDKAYVTDATFDDLELVAHDLEELSDLDDELDDIFNRSEIELDMEIWGEFVNQ